MDSTNQTPVEIENRHATLYDSLKKSVFIIGSSLVVFVALRNSITWHLQSFWGASGDFWESQWLKVHSFFGGDSMMMGIWGTAVISACAYWIYNAFFLFMDITASPKTLRKYKIQEDKNVPVDPLKLRHAIKLILFNQLVAGVPFLYVVHRAMVWRGCSFGTVLPSFPRVIWEFFCMIWIEEFGFYYSHRLLHHPRLYKHIHKIHHEWTASISVVSIYSHPIEHVLSNLLPPILGPLIMGSHVATFWLWFAMVIGSTTIAHCGYHLPFFPSPEAHDFHHLKFNYNYGVLGVLDRIHGTDTAFRNSKAYSRHFMLLSLVPMKQLIPDDVDLKLKGKLTSTQEEAPCCSKMVENAADDIDDNGNVELLNEIQGLSPEVVTA